jgi:hypothetical protein
MSALWACQVAHAHTASTQGLEKALLEGLSCPISFQLMTDAVVAEDGHTYRQEAIEAWIAKCTSGAHDV